MARLLGACVIVPSSSSSSIDGDGGSTSLPSARSVHRNFQGLSLCFGLAHGSQAVVMALASSMIGPSAAGVSTAALYIGYTLSALVCSAPITRALAPRAAMVLAMLLFAVYLLSFLLALLLPVPGAAQWLSVIGGACAGFAAAVLWTAQGSYFALSAKALAICTGKTSEATTMQLASLFARYYLGSEMAMKLISFAMLFSIRPTATSNSGTNGTNITAVGALQQQHGQAPMDTMSAHGKSMEVETLIVLSAIALVSTSASLLTYDLRDATDKGAGKDGGEGSCTPQVLQPLMVACRFFSAHRAELLLLLPFNVAFGFTAAFVINFIDARIATANLGEAAVPVLTGVTAGVAALAAHPMSVAARKTRATLVIAVSAACLVVPASVVLIDHVTSSANGSDGGRFGWALLVALYTCHGLGRSCWETVFKAQWASRFGKDAPGAFANLIVQFGVSSFAAYLILPNASLGAACILCIAACAMAVGASVQLERLAQRRALRPALLDTPRQSGLAAAVGEGVGGGAAGDSAGGGAGGEEEEEEEEARARANPITIELDFRQVGSDVDMWDEINAKLGFDDFGRNLDALVDVLRGGFGHFENWEYVKLVVHGRAVAAAHCSKWAGVQEIIDESVEGVYGEQVAAVEWCED